MAFVRPWTGWVMALLCGLAPALPAGSHDFWVAMEAPPDSPADAVVLAVASGHAFPRSEGLPAQRLVRRFAWQDPGGAWREAALPEDGRLSVPVPAPGLYRVLLVLQPPRARQPIYTAQTVFQAGAGAPGPWPAPLGTDVEVTVAHDARGGIRIQTLRDGEPVHATVTAYIPDTRPQRIPTGPGEPGFLALPDDSPCLLTASVGPQSGALLLMQRPPETP